jgi:hypothetical protein
LFDGSEVADRLAAPADCDVAAEQHVSPNPVAVGDTLDVMLRLQVACQEAPWPMHVVMAVDTSSADAEGMRQIQDRLRFTMLRFQMDADLDRRMGIVAFAESAHGVCELTHVEAELLQCIATLSPGESSRPDLGIEEAAKVLARGRHRATDRENIREVVVLLQRSQPAVECAAALAAAGAIKGQGVLMMTGCLGAGCDESCTRQMATSGRYFFLISDTWTPLMDILERIRDDSLRPEPDWISVADVLPANMRYVAGSANPPARFEDGRLEWNRLRYAAEGMTLTLQLVPTEVGVWPVSSESTALIEFRSRFDAISTTFSGAEVTVNRTSVFLPSLSAGAP